MAEVSDLQLVLDSIKALDILPPRHRSVQAKDGSSTSEDWGTLLSEFDTLTLIQQGQYETLEKRVFGNGEPLDPENEARIRRELEERAEKNKWTALPWGRERLRILMMRHLDGSVSDAPHHGFHGPRAGKGFLAFELRPATSVEWLVHCPERCMACQVTCRNDLERLRRALQAEADEAKRNNPAVHWKEDRDSKSSKIPRVEIWDGTRRVAIKGRKADLFLRVAEKSPQVLAWNEYIRYLLGIAETRIQSQSARLKSEDISTPRVALRDDSVAKLGRDVRKSLEGLGTFWNQDPIGAAWNPPPGSGPA